MYYRFIYWIVACRTIIFVFLIAWDPCALSFPGLYQVPGANPCIPHCLLTTKMWSKNCVLDTSEILFHCVWALLQSSGNIPCIAGSSCSLCTAQGLVLLHLQAPVLEAQCENAHAGILQSQYGLCSAPHLICNVLMSEQWGLPHLLDIFGGDWGFRSKLSCLQIRCGRGYSAPLESGPYVGRR